MNIHKSILSIAFLLLVTACDAEPKEAMSAFYERYRSNINVEQIRLPRFVLRFCADDPDVKASLKYMKSLKIFMMDASSTQRNNVSEDLNKALAIDAYGDILELSEADEHIKIWVREDKEWIKNVVITIENNHELIVLHANTKITYDQLSLMIQDIKSDKGKSSLHKIVGKNAG